MKRLLHSSIFLLAVLVFIAGFGSGGQAIAQDKARLMVWNYHDPEQLKGFNTIVERFKKIQDRIDIEYENIPFAESKKRYTVALAANSLPDIIQCGTSDVVPFGLMGMFEDISGKLARWEGMNQFFPGLIGATSWKGKTYGLPIDTCFLLLYYNKDWFEKTGIKKLPETWDELRATAKKLSDPARGKYGINTSLAKGSDIWWSFQHFLYNAGGEVTKMDAPEAREVVKLWKGLIDDGSMSKDNLNLRWGDTNKQFTSGNCAMMLNGPWSIGMIATDNPSMKYGVMLLPKKKQYAVVVGGDAIGICKGGKNIEAAWEFVKFFTNGENLRGFNKIISFTPPRKDALADAFFQQGFMKSFSDAVQYSAPLTHPRLEEIYEPVSTALQDILTNQKSVDAALKSCQEKIDELNR